MRKKNVRILKNLAQQSHKINDLKKKKKSNVNGNVVNIQNFLWAFARILNAILNTLLLLLFDNVYDNT